MKINTWSALLSFIFTLLLFVTGVRIVVGQIQVSEIVTSLILFLPFFIFIFALFYLLSSHILNKIQDHKFIQPFLVKAKFEKGETELKYFLPMVYRILGILLLLSTILLSYLDHHVLMMFLIFFLVSYYLKTPYRIEFVNGYITIFSLSGKKNIKRDDVSAIKMGVFHNRVNCADKFFYLSHFVTNVSYLTREIAKLTANRNLEQAKIDKIDKRNDSPTFWVYRALVLLIFSILISVLCVLFFINYVKQMHYP